MKKLTILNTVLLLIISFLGYSQKIKIKKGVILIDKTEIPIKIDSEFVPNRGGTMGDFHQILNFTNASTSDIFVIVDHKGKMMPSGIKEVWMEISDPSRKRTNAIDMDIKLGYSKKAIVKHLLFKYGFFDVEGNVNQNKITEFFDTETESLAKKRANKGKEAEIKVAEARKTPIEIDINTKDILSQGEKIGFYKPEPGNTLVIADLDNKKIATASINSLKGIVEVVSPFLNNGFSYKNPVASLIVDTDGKETIKFVKEFVYQLKAKGLNLGHQLADKKLAKRAERSEAFEEAKAASSNIYDVTGYAVNDKGEKFEGILTAKFEEIKNPLDPISSGMSNIDDGGIGSSVLVKYKNDKGKDKFKSIGAKNNAYFCITKSDNKEVCYYTVKKEGGPILGSNDGALALASSKGKFMEEVYSGENFKIFLYYGNSTYYLKKNDKEKAFDFKISGFTKNETKATKLKEYLGGCDYTDKNRYDSESFNLEKIKELIDYYNTSCK